MTRGLAAWILAVGTCTAVPEFARADAPREIDGIVAIVGARTPRAGADVVLRSDVELRARLALMGRGEPVSLPIPAGLFSATLEQIIGELLLAREAARLRAEEPSSADVARERARLTSASGGSTDSARLLEALGATSAEIDAIASRRAYVDAFLRANLEGSTEISDAAVATAYESEETPFRDQPLIEVREALRAWLAARALERDVRRWIEVLRTRNPVRMMLSTAAE